jgi:ABC-type protease/lipase transport system fused ATPase/permease subunit
MSHSRSPIDPSRRAFLGHAGGLGGLALLDLLGSSNASAAEAGEAALQALHHAAKAKRVIFLFMAGAPSQLECFDNKPKLREMHG